MGNGALRCPRRGARRGEARDSDVPTSVFVRNRLARRPAGTICDVGKRRRPSSLAARSGRTPRRDDAAVAAAAGAAAAAAVLLWERTGPTTSELFCGTPATACCRSHERRPMVFPDPLVVLKS